MIQEQAKILSNQKIADQVYKMEIETTLSSQSAQGQFVEIQVPGYYLRRPISINYVDYEQNRRWRWRTTLV